MKKYRFLAISAAVMIVISVFFLLGASAERMPYVTSDTACTLSCEKNATYQFQFTVHGTHGKPAVTVGNKKILQVKSLTSDRDAQGDDVYYFKVKALGETKASTGVYTTLPGQYPDLQCTVSVIDGTIPYQNLYAGFIDDEKNILPVGDVLIQTQGDWDTFQKKYLQMSPDLAYRNLPKVDFTKNAILYHMEYTAAKEDVYLYARPIDKVLLVNGMPVLKEGSFADNFEISTAAHRSHYVILVQLKKADVS